MLASLVAPVLFVLGSAVWFITLPYAAISTHWLSADNVIRATNGPPAYFYEYVVEPTTPLHIPVYAKEWEFGSAKEHLRAHVASVYLSDSQHAAYLSKAYPERWKKKLESGP